MAKARITDKPATPDSPVLKEPRMLLTFREAAHLLNIGESSLREHLTDKYNPITQRPYLLTVKLGDRRLVPRKALEQYIDSLLAGA